uniref:Uncharacterized protein n=1 Tax=Arundo donax TaxID=35708 RepID=A0A0A8ZNU1_ARUDO
MYLKYNLQDRSSSILLSCVLQIREWCLMCQCNHVKL